MSLDIYDRMPDEMRDYLRHYGWNFNKKACEYAVGMMKRSDESGQKAKKIQPWTKEDVENMLKAYGIELEHNKGYNHVYVANMVKADMLKKSVPDEQHAAMYIRDVIDDVDNLGGNVFRKWYCDMVAKGEIVEWEEIL